MLSKKDQIIAKNKEEKGGAESAKAFDAWTGIMKAFDELSSDQDKYLRASAYLAGLDSQRAGHVGLDINAYMVHALLARWSKYCQLEKKKDGLYVIALMWNVIRTICTSKVPLTKEVAHHLEKTCTLVSITDAISDLPKVTRKYPNNFVWY